MTTIEVELSDEMRAFVEAQATEHGCESASAYLLALIRDAQVRHAKLKLEAKLREALEAGPAEIMTREDWESIEREALEGLARERQRP